MATLFEITNQFMGFHQRGSADMDQIRSNPKNNGESETLNGHRFYSRRENRHIICKGNEINGLLANF